MSSKYILDENHKAIPVDNLIDWAEWMEHRESRRVAYTEVGESNVSTVFLGLDHQWGEGPPILFETMVFGGPLNEYQERCSTWEEAVRQHEWIVLKATEAMGKSNGQATE